MGLTKTTDRMTSGGQVNVMDFGAVGDGTTDDSAAIQAAIDYCLVNTLTLDSNFIKTLIIPGNHKLDTPLTIDLNLGQRNFFRIEGRGTGAGFTTANIPFAFTTTGQTSHMIIFSNLAFNGSYVNSGLERYAFNLEKLFRITIENCAFMGIRVGYSPQYVQSVRFTGCAVRGVKGSAFYFGDAIFDVTIEDSIFETIESHAIHQVPAVNAGIFMMRIVNNVFQSLSGDSIRLEGSSKNITITGNYTEGNTGRFLYLQKSWSANVSDNRMQATAANIADTTFFDILVNDSVTFIGSGNAHHDGRLYDITGNADIGLGDFAALQLSRNFIQSARQSNAMTAGGVDIPIVTGYKARMFEVTKGASGAVTTVVVSLNGVGVNLNNSIVVEIKIAAYHTAQLDYLFTSHDGASIIAYRTTQSTINLPTYTSKGEGLEFTVSTAINHPVVYVKVISGGYQQDNSLAIEPTITIS
jgi:hypothetical protein